MRNADRHNHHWLRVALRAAEHKLHAGASAMGELTHRTIRAAEQRMLAERAAQALQVDWRQRRLQPGADPQLDEHYRRYARYLGRAQSERAQAEAALQTELAAEQSALRRQLAEKNGLKAAADRREQAHWAEHLRQEHLRADDESSIRRTATVCADEDR